MEVNSLQQFLAHVQRHGFSKPTRFQVIIPLPDALQQRFNEKEGADIPILDNAIVRTVRTFLGSSSNDMVRGLDLMTEIAAIPGKELTTTDIKYNSDFFKIPYSVVYPAQNFTFLVSRDMFEKRIIDEWMNLIIDPLTHEVGYMDDYATNVIINQLDESDRIVHSVVLWDAFPLTATEMQLSQQDRDMIHRLQTTWAYRRWTNTETEQPKGITSLTETPLGPYVTPILANPAVQKTLEVFERETGVNLDGEAANIYNQIDSIAKNTTGSSVNRSASLFESIRASTLNNDKLTPTQQSKIIDIIDDALTTLRS